MLIFQFVGSRCLAWRNAVGWIRIASRPATLQPPPIVLPSITISDDATTLFNNKVVSIILEKLTPVGDAMEALDLANEAANTLSALGIPDQQIIVAGLMIVVIVGWVVYNQRTISTDLEDVSPDNIPLGNGEDKALAKNDDKTLEKLRDELQVEQTRRKTAEHQLKLFMEKNEELSIQCKDLERKLEKLEENNTLLSDQLNQREHEFEVETNSMRRLSAKLMQLPWKRVLRRLKR